MWDKVGPRNWRRPLLLQPDNFTPPERTPWGGRRIAGTLKLNAGVGGSRRRRRGLGALRGARFSEPDCRGAAARRGAPSGPCAPRERGPARIDGLAGEARRRCRRSLGSDSPGGRRSAACRGRERKTGSLVHHRRRPGRRLVPRFSRRSVAPRRRAAIDERGDVDRLMSFVPVSAGDVFSDRAGDATRDRQGVLLLEPQRVSPGKRGLTYRYWDWNRKYDAAGRLDPSGQPRALHRERALDVTRWEGPREAQAPRPTSADARVRPRPAGSARLEVLVGKRGLVRRNVLAATFGRLRRARPSRDGRPAFAHGPRRERSHCAKATARSSSRRPNRGAAGLPRPARHRARRCARRACAHWLDATVPA